jgi:CheY-like chemotaxis protein/HPt (histidine-containing phosphotransfer) domain-containing protein
MLDFIAPHELPTVLLIDDDMVSREVMATVLTMSGYPVHTAADGELALAMLAAKQCRPGVILLDAQLPGVSGVKLIKRLRGHSKARLYVISGSEPTDDVQDAADGFLLKPFPPESLTRLIERQESGPRTAVGGLDPAETVVDAGTLAQLREMMPEAAVRQIFEAILTDLGKRIALLESAIAKPDWVEARRIGHAIKGGGSMAGALQVSRLGELIESGGLEPVQAAFGVNQSDNSSMILADLRAAAGNLQRILDAEMKA